MTAKYAENLFKRMCKEIKNDMSYLYTYSMNDIKLVE